LAVALFVRFEDPARRRRDATGLVANATDVRLVRVQHRVFYTVLLAAPVEWWWRGRPAAWTQLLGAAVFLAGVVGYRVVGAALGDQLSPLVAPREPARLIDDGPYRRVRHPMYVAELTIATGAPLTLGARVSLLLALAFAAVVVYRMAVEERALRARIPEYAAYAARTYRLIPYVY